MAPYFRDPNLDKDEEPGSVQVSSSGTQAGPDGQASQGTAGISGKPVGSRFTNIDQYLQGGQGKAMGEQFGGKIQGDIDTAKSTLDTTAGSVKSQIASSGTIPTQDEINRAVSGAGDQTTDAQAKQYQDWTKQTYKGPNGLSDNQAAWNDYWSKANQATSEANAAGSQGGRFALLDKFYGRPSYTQGQKKLDNMLIQAGGGFTNQADLQTQAQGLGSSAAQAAQEVQNQAAQRANQINQSRQAARSALGLQDNGTIQGGAIGNFESGLDQRVKDETLKRQQQYGADRQALSGTSGGLSSEYISRFGLNPGQTLFNVDLSKFLSPGGAPTKETLAGPEDYSKYLALSRLAGVDPTYLTPDQLSRSGQIAPRDTFNKEAFQSALEDERVRTDAAANNPVDLGRYGSQSINEMKHTIATQDKYAGGNGDGRAIASFYAGKGGSAPEMYRLMMAAIDNFNKSNGMNRVISSRGPVSTPYRPIAPYIRGAS